ncbi:MAG TPA: PH domain-containing protein [Bacteroidia bacterium]|jgi:hypothetical protein|nr:PH domain-containing protein [Bacteroidia bacterium]
MKTTYTASLDTFAKVITCFVFLIFIGGIAVMLSLTPWYEGLLITIVPVIILVPTYMYSVKSYQITNDKLIIERTISKLDKEIPLSEIENVSIPGKEDFNWTIRALGDAGLFGYYGLFANPKLGSFRAYATNRKNRVLIVLKAKKDKIVLSPDDAGMAEALQKLIKKQA